jgi:putative MATE family efflux protein
VENNRPQTSPVMERENIMGTMEINPLLVKLSVPMMISMLVQALYNVVDSVFVSWVSEEALTAVSLAFSLQNMMIAVGVGTGVGVNAMLSKSLGEKNQKRANATAENGIFLSACSFLVFLVIGLTCIKPYFYAQTSDDAIALQGIQYLSVCCIFSLGLFTQTMGEKLLAATGRTQLSMISQLVGAVVNIILDPIFIFGYCGEALSGTTGAAVATVIGQFCGAGMTLYFNTRKNPDIQLDFKGFRPSAKAIGRIYTVGLPSIAMQCVGSLMTFGMNLILMAFSSTAVAVFGVYFKLQSFVFMPIFGLNNGMVPIISYNYGARRPERVRKTIRLAVCYAEGIMVLGFCIFEFFPGQVLGLFSASQAMLTIGIPAMRIICLHFLLAGTSIVLSSVFQALGNGLFSLIVSVCRQLFVLLPAAWLLAQTGNVNNVWWAFLIAEIVSVLMSLAFYAHINKTIIVPLCGPVEP